MVFNDIINFFQSFLWTTIALFPYFIVILIVYFIAKKFLFNRFQEKYKMDWFKATSLTTFIIFLIILTISYIYVIYPLIQVNAEYALYYGNENFSILNFLFSIIKVPIVAGILTMILLPFQLLGALLLDFFDKKYKRMNPIIKTIIALLIVLIVILIIFVYVFPFLLTWLFLGLTYFMFF